eukprot:TRINITY_DN4081_c0_g1_i3.p1 TRINITY_DN4081_c0_g1~~TRINITY_DN4081_c0_g1_i3.p1  ORF type:complete len:746 (+),score=197.65 TRINITY_DN4081_c0_g1_i3:183-2420(+)
MESRNIQKALEQAFKTKDLWKVMRILHHAKGGLLDYICNNLYHFSDRDIQIFLPQLCTRVLKDPQEEVKSLERFLMDRCASLNLAMLMFFWFQAAEEDGSFLKKRCNDLWHECEMAAVNSRSRVSLRMMDYKRNLSVTKSQPLSVSQAVNMQSISTANSPIDRTYEHPPMRYSASLNDLTSLSASGRSRPPNITPTASDEAENSQSEEVLIVQSEEAQNGHKPSKEEETRVAVYDHTTGTSSYNTPGVTLVVTPATASEAMTVETIVESATEVVAEAAVVIEAVGEQLSLAESQDAPVSPVKRFRSPSVGSPPLQITSNLTTDGAVVETFVVASPSHRRDRGHVRSPSTGGSVPASPRQKQHDRQMAQLANRMSQVKLVVPPSPGKMNIELLEADNIHSKKSRHYYFQAELQFLALLSGISTSLKRYGFRTKLELNTALVSLLRQLQDTLTAENKLGTEFYANRGLYLPNSLRKDAHYRVVRILPDESQCMSSKDRVPFMLFVETLMMPPEEKEGKDDPCLSPLESPKASHQDAGLVQALDGMINLNRETKKAEMNKQQQQKEAHKQMSGGMEEDWVVVTNSSPLSLAYPELWVAKEARLRATSPFGSDPRWRLQSVIVKSGDDLRQEQLAVQLINTFHQIFKDAELHLWLKPYSVVATSSQTGLIETIPDAISLDALKKRIPSMTTLDDYFVAMYGPKTSISFIQAQRNFVESLAGYSLVCWLLQIKDRHNGNILIDTKGKVPG